MKVTPIIILLLLALVGAPIVLWAQKIITDADAKTVDVSPEFKDIDVHLNAVKKIPEFGGGKKTWQNFLQSNINIRIPFANKAKLGTYWVLIKFIVGKDGKLRAIGADTNCGYGMESEVIRCIQKSPNWIPAETKTGIKVSFTMRTAVTFVVKQNDVTLGFL